MDPADGEGESTQPVPAACSEQMRDVAARATAGQRALRSDKDPLERRPAVLGQIREEVFEVRQRGDVAAELGAVVLEVPRSRVGSDGGGGVVELREKRDPTEEVWTTEADEAGAPWERTPGAAPRARQRSRGTFRSPRRSP